MKMKKILCSLVAGAAILTLAACGNKDKQKTETLDGKPIDYKKDAVDKKNKVVDGKEVTEYTMPDGNIVQIPVDNEEDTDTADSSAE